MRKISKQDQNPWRAFALVGVIGFDLAICVVLGVWVGNWLDRRFETEPLFLLIGIFTGLVIAILLIINIIKKFTEDESNG